MNKNPLLRQSFTIGIILLFFWTGILITCAQNYEEPVPSPITGNILNVGGSGPGNYTNIQEAIDAATEGDTIYVFQGTYNGSIFLNTGNISLIGEDKNTTILDGTSGAQSVVTINSSGINIQGFTIVNGGDGILMNDGSSNMVIGNILKQNQNAIRITGYQSNNLINGNIIESNQYGIYYSSGGGEPTCTYFQFTNNIIRFNDNTALYFLVSIVNSTISGNTISDNGKGIEFLYEGLSESNYIYHNNFINNTENAEDQGANSWYNTTINQGNYWNDYTGVDDNYDGFGDTPYNISEARQDFYPYMNQNGWLNIPPIAEAGGPYSATAGHMITFKGSASNDPDGIIEGYRWDFTSDGIYETDWLSLSTTSYSYASKGTYTVTLQVKDNEGVARTDTASVLISKAGGGGGGGGGDGSPPPVPENKKPIADVSAGEPYQGLVKTPILFDGSRSYDPDGSITTWLWVFSDNTSATGEKVNHTFSKPGTYSVSLAVTDTEGATNTDTTTCVITQPNSPPSRPTMSGPIYGTKNTRYDYTVRSTDPDNDNISYIISWDELDFENTSAFLPSNTPYTFSHQWLVPGIYTISVSATDNETRSSFTNLTILIDVKYVKDLGYLINQDHDGIYDMFHSNSTELETRVQKQADGLYLINSDSDRDWDYSYNPATSVLSVYTPSTPGFELVYVLCTITVATLLWKKKRNLE